MANQFVQETGGAYQTGNEHICAEKALALNIDTVPYGTFAEIGGGQEVARWFFRVGGAAGTVAKTMSAYDMQYSDAIYGKAERYVSKEKLLAMLVHEYQLLIERLSETRGSKSRFFVFADTVAARNFSGSNECHGWMGVRFQAAPGGEPNDILLHVNLLDSNNLAQQQALGMLGVNLIHAAIYNNDWMETLLPSLLDALSIARVEIDYIQFAGPLFENISSQRAGLELLRCGLCHAVMFDTNGALVQPSSVLHKRAVIMQRGSFHKTTPYLASMLNASRDALIAEVTPKPKAILPCFELTIRSARHEDQLSDDQIVERLENLRQYGFPTFVTDFAETYHITEYLRRYSKEPIRLVVGVGTLVPILRAGFYSEIEGGLLEALGKLLMQGVKVYAFPMSHADFVSKLELYGVDKDFCRAPANSLVTAQSLEFPGALQHLFNYLLAAGHLIPMETPTQI